ncbi:HAD family hydrolase [Pseudomonas sp. P5_152]|jgi:phosphoserine phosphatase|uniref:HAD family hydrolase n=1 Tax=unclassified Pseudomonas TaxID=196821 RepID=UPI00131FC435|nr:MULTISPECIES: HAD family hydrolase [unclassified Pseudomonas]MDX9663407.1 HAD family hydrolase [Pseudomonas sp. P5_152]QHD01375.1 haloacid dehalogenase [Pseudomonas sp. S04]QHF33859.1 haloacid dehalogenase [Pseudomonas sp. S19]
MTNHAAPRQRHAFKLLLSLALSLPLLALAAEPLPSWNDGPSKKSIIEFVQAVTTEGSKDYVKPAERIAVFDNDGTLWSEQPMYFQVLFALEEVKRMAPQHPQWKTEQPFKAVLENDHQALAASGMDGLMKIIGATHTGITTAAFMDNAKTWLSQARHPKTGKPYTEMIFQPMLEMLDYLRSQDFKTYIVSGGEVEFMRAFAEQVYGIPPEQVIGTTFATQFQLNGNDASILRLPKLAHNDDGPGKPESIQQVIGRQPILAFGNSDGDLQMLQWTAAGPGKRFMGLVHHTDAKREWAYDRQSNIGRLDKALDEANKRGWSVVDMSTEWNRIYPFDTGTTEQKK